MLETLLPLALPPGLVNNGTVYQTKGRWHTGNLVRFHQNRVMPIGGWAQRTLTGATIAGTPNACASWIDNSNQAWIAVGTTQNGTNNLYVIDSQNVVYDVTPLLAVTSTPSTDIVWQLDTFGEILVGTVVYHSTEKGDTNTTLFEWQPPTTASPTPARATLAYTYTASGVNSPFGVVVTPERFAVLLRGTDPVTGTYSGRTVYWPNQESLTVWVPSDTNSAGSQPLATQGVLVCGRNTRGATLLWTTTDLWTMTYTGSPFIYSFAKVGDNCGIISPNAVVVMDTQAIWMGYRNFYTYDGFVKPVPCDVTDYVFGNFNTTYAYKVWALANPLFSEVTWFYPSAASTAIDSYVTYNYQERHWTFGTLARTTGVTRQAGVANQVPVLFDGSGNCYDHETGNVGHESASLESGPVEIGNGDQVMRVQRIVPDDDTQGDVNLSLYTSLFPDATETLNGPYTAASPTSVRLTARQVRLKIAQANVADWRLGTVRLGVIPGGRR